MVRRKELARDPLDALGQCRYVGTAIATAEKLGTLIDERNTVRRMQRLSPRRGDGAALTPDHGLGGEAGRFLVHPV